MFDRATRSYAPALSAWLPAILVGSAVYALLVGAGGRLLNDADTYWHVAVGQSILGGGSFPYTDGFSFTKAGTPWIAKEWLSQVVFALAFKGAGWGGVVALAAAAGALAFAMLARALFAAISPAPALVLLSAALALSAPHLLARPHILALPVLVAWSATLLNAAASRSAPPLALAGLMVLWANLHGGFLFGLALAGFVALEAVAQAPRPERAALLARWGRFLALSAAAACATPYGAQTIAAALRVLGIGSGLGVIAEWQPQSFARFSTFEGLLLLGMGFAFARGFVVRPVTRLAALLGIIYLALNHTRYSELVAFVGPLLLIPSLGILSGAPVRMPGSSRLSLLATCGAIAALFVASATLPTRGFAPAQAITPAAAVAALREQGSRRIFNDYNFGGYLIAVGIPTFIDGRTELYGGPFVKRYFSAVTLSDPADFRALLDEYRIDGVLLSPRLAAARFLDGAPEWNCLYRDAVSVAYAKAPRALASSAPR